MAVGFFFPFPKVSVARACACGQSPWFSLWKKRERERGGSWDTWAVKVIRIFYLHFQSPSSASSLLSQVRMVGEWEKNIGELKPTRRGEAQHQSSFFFFLSFYSIRPRFHLSGFRVVIRHMYRLLLLLLPKKDWRHLVTIDNVRSAKKLFFVVVTFLERFSLFVSFFVSDLAENVDCRTARDCPISFMVLFIFLFGVGSSYHSVFFFLVFVFTIASLIFFRDFALNPSRSSQSSVLLFWCDEVLYHFLCLEMDHTDCHHG